ncbi:unnamed protein product, partial [Rotaria socialis]
MVRSPLDSSQELIILGLAFLWQIVSYLHGLVLKDFKRNNCIKLVSYLFFNMDGKTTTTTWDITVFLNVTNGTFILHREDVAMLRFYLAAYISTTKHFRHIFATNGHPLIMLTFLRVYSNIQLNPMLKRSIKYYCRYCFYITSYTIYITNHYHTPHKTIITPTIMLVANLTAIAALGQRNNGWAIKNVTLSVFGISRSNCGVDIA